ncbi:hypothetical protein Gotur_024529 [Gossypium turneri]
MNDMKLFDSFLQELVGAEGKPRNGLERVNGRLEFQSDRLVHKLSKDDHIHLHFLFFTAPVGPPLIHLGDDKWCMVWHSCTLNCFEYLIFRMWRNGHGGIYAAAVGGYRTSASFGSINPTILMP